MELTFQQNFQFLCGGMRESIYAPMYRPYDNTTVNLYRQV